MKKVVFITENVSFSSKKTIQTPRINKCLLKHYCSDI